MDLPVNCVEQKRAETLKRFDFVKTQLVRLRERRRDGRYTKLLPHVQFTVLSLHGLSFATRVEIKSVQIYERAEFFEKQASPRAVREDAWPAPRFLVR